MQAIAFLVAVIALVTTVSLGILVHELSHAVVLHLLGIPYTVQWFPEVTAGGQFSAGISGAWAAVTPQEVTSETPAWQLRLSAVAPLTLVLPFIFVFAGLLPDPLASGNVVLAAITMGWFACALPSPQDFSVFWYASARGEQHG